jgi:phosphate:Na+ symporter
MEMLDSIPVWTVLAGLGLFLFGMFMLEEALRNLAGRSFKLFLRQHTNRPVKAIASGALVTSILQSSSLVTLLVMSLTGAGIVGFNSGLGMIMGANLGTTATGWLVALIGFKLNIEAFVLPFLAIGGLGIAFLKSEKLSNLSKLLMGFSFMFLGLNYMKNSFAHLATQVDFSILSDKPMVLFVLFGFVLTALIQSSSASMTIYLSSLAAGIITLPQAAFLVIGSDLGTTVTGIIGTLNGNAIRRKTGWSQFFFNLVSSMLGLALFKVLFFVIEEGIGITDPLTALVFFHSSFNFCAVLVVGPFINVFTRILDKYVKVENKTIAKFVAGGNPHESVSGLESLQKEIPLFLDKVLNFNSNAFLKGKKGGVDLSAYFHIKQYEKEIGQFYNSLLQIPLNKEEILLINNLVAAVRNGALSAKDLKDIKHTLQEFENAASDKANRLLTQIKDNQQFFYSELKLLILNMENIIEQDFDRIKDLQNKFYREETSNLYQLFSQSENEIDINSGLNMLREISSSNESLVKAFKNLVKK